MKHVLMTAALLLAALPAAYADGPEPQKQVWRAAMKGEAALTALLSSGVSVNTSDWEGETALMEAADKGQLEVVRLLLRHGADVNAADEDGETALMRAADDGHTEVVRALIAAGADVNARDEDGETALSNAEEERHLETARVLREAGARR